MACLNGGILYFKIKIEMFIVFSFCYQFSDEPHLDGQDKDAAGEKVCSAPCWYFLYLFTFLGT